MGSQSPSHLPCEIGECQAQEEALGETRPCSGVAAKRLPRFTGTDIKFLAHGLFMEQLYDRALDMQ